MALVKQRHSDHSDSQERRHNDRRYKPADHHVPHIDKKALRSASVLERLRSLLLLLLSGLLVGRKSIVTLLPVQKPGDLGPQRG